MALVSVAMSCELEWDTEDRWRGHVTLAVGARENIGGDCAPRGVWVASTSRG